MPEPDVKENHPVAETHRGVGDLVRPVAVTVAPSATLREAAEAMTHDGVGLVVATVGGKLRGVVSERDLVAAIAEGADVDNDRVDDVMALDVVLARPDMAVGDAIAAMLEGGIRHLPVMDGERLIGVTSMRDLLAAVAPTGS